MEEAIARDQHLALPLSTLKTSVMTVLLSNWEQLGQISPFISNRNCGLEISNIKPKVSVQNIKL